MASLKIAYRNIADLRPRSGNPRTHSKRQIEQIAASILRFGFTNPVLIDQNDGVLAGHGRLKAAQTLDMSEVPTLRLTDLNEAEIRAYVIADNRLAEKAGWDQDLLGVEFKYLAELDFDFDLTLTGFELPEIDAVISGIGLHWHIVSGIARARLPILQNRIVAAALWAFAIAVACLGINSSFVMGLGTRLTPASRHRCRHDESKAFPNADCEFLASCNSAGSNC